MWGLSTYKNVAPPKTSNISLTGDITCSSLTTTGASGLAAGANLVTNASTSQTGALSCSNISATGSGGIAACTGTCVHAAIMHAGTIVGSSMSTTGNISARG